MKGKIAMSKTYLKCCTNRDHAVTIMVTTHKSEEDIIKAFERLPKYIRPNVKVESGEKHRTLLINGSIEDTSDVLTDTNIGISKAIKACLINMYDTCCEYCGDVSNWIPDGNTITIMVRHRDMLTRNPVETWIMGEDCGGWSLASMLETVVESLRNGEDTYLY